MRPQADADADGQCLSRHLSGSAPLRHLRTFLRTLRTFEMSARFSSHGAAPASRIANPVQQRGDKTMTTQQAFEDDDFVLDPPAPGQAPAPARVKGSTEHVFKDTNRHLVEVPDSYAVARWPRNADAVTIARCILTTLKFEPRSANAPDITALRQALADVIHAPDP